MPKPKGKITYRKDLMSFYAAADELGVSPTTIYRWRDDEKFAVTKISGTSFIHVEDVERLRKGVVK